MGWVQEVIDVVEYVSVLLMLWLEVNVFALYKPIT
jgi:hypothetical protein